MELYQYHEANQGIITIEDIIEELFGEIEDEHDSQDLLEKKINKDTFIFSCDS